MYLYVINYCGYKLKKFLHVFFLEDGNVTIKQQNKTKPNAQLKPSECTLWSLNSDYSDRNSTKESSVAF